MKVCKSDGAALLHQRADPADDGMTLALRTESDGSLARQGGQATGDGDQPLRDLRVGQTGVACELLLMPGHQPAETVGAAQLHRQLAGQARSLAISQNKQNENRPV